MATSTPAQTATPGTGSRVRVTARARNRRRAPIEGGYVRSRYAPASEASIAAVTALLDQRRGVVAPRGDRSAPRRLIAGLGALALTAATGLFVAALVAGSMLGMILLVLNIER